MKKIFQDLLDNIPEYREFLTLEELDANSDKLAAEYPDVASVFNFGKTQSGYDLKCLKIGNYDKAALMYGCPHPNEPIGTMMLEYFTENLVKNKELRDELGYTWYIVKAWDADGLKKNEKWLKGPYNLYNYSRNFFRPAGHKQVDWTFPVDYKNFHFHDSIPETEAMMKLIDEIKPVLTYALHNAGFGGVYWYLTHNLPELYPGFKEATYKMGVPLNLGEPESPSCVAWEPAVYQKQFISNKYDYYEKNGIEHPEKLISYGDCSAAYAYSRYNTLTFLTEMPYFYDKRIDDVSEGNMMRRDAVLKSMDLAAEKNRFIRGIIEDVRPCIDPEDGYLLAIDSFTKSESDEATRNMIAKNPDYNRMATVCEELDNLLVSRFYGLLQYGMAVRMIETELENMDRTGENDPVKRHTLEGAFYRAEREHKRVCEELESKFDYSVVPIRKLIYIQLNAGLMVADYLNHNKLPENN